MGTTDIRRRIGARTVVPLRVDFAGGWLDVPRLARTDGLIVNCAIEPLVSLERWPYEQNSGLGGSAAYSLLTGRNAVDTELETAGWQDPAVILETGLCIWASGKRPELRQKINPEFLYGKMGLLWTGEPHAQTTGEAVDFERDYAAIAKSGAIAAMGCAIQRVDELCRGVDLYYQTQVKEGMKGLPAYGALARKYCGSGHGGYAVYIFESQDYRDAWVSQDETERRAIEPYMRGVSSYQYEA